VVFDVILDGDGDVAVDDPFLEIAKAAERGRCARMGQASVPGDVGAHGAKSDPFTATSHVAVAVHAHDHVNDLRPRQRLRLRLIQD
jgi:hypothetical protein